MADNTSALGNLTDAINTLIKGLGLKTPQDIQDEKNGVSAEERAEIKRADEFMSGPNYNGTIKKQEFLDKEVVEFVDDDGQKSYGTTYSEISTLPNGTAMLYSRIIDGIKLTSAEAFDYALNNNKHLGIYGTPTTDKDQEKG